MKRIQLAVFVASIVLGSASLAAQQPAAKKATAQRDSLKTVKRTIKQDKAARKTAKAKGDTATARKLKTQLKAEKKTKDALKTETGKTAPAKKPE
jgi:hypothetical protein